MIGDDEKEQYFQQGYEAGVAAERERIMALLRHELMPKPPVSKSKTERGTRIPQPFLLTREMREWAAVKRPDVDVMLETEKFCNYWRSMPGVKARKINWRFTWNTWILNANGTHQQPANISKPTNLQRITETYDVISQYPTEAELAGVTGEDGINVSCP